MGVGEVRAYIHQRGGRGGGRRGGLRKGQAPSQGWVGFVQVLVAEGFWSVGRFYRLPFVLLLAMPPRFLVFVPFFVSFSPGAGPWDG